MNASEVNHPAMDLFCELLDVPAPSGREDRVASIVRAKLDALGVAHRTDGAGNVVVRLDGADGAAPLRCLAAHTDEIGLVVTAIAPDGVLRVDRSGGLHPWKYGEGPIEILGDNASVTGVLSFGSTHGVVSDKAVTWGDCRILTGLTDAELAAAGVRAGSPGVPTREVRGPIVLGGRADPLVAAWTFDDRMGVVALLRLAGAVAGGDVVPAAPTILAFTVGEEDGGHGAKVVARDERPEILLAVDGCPMPAGTNLTLDGRPGAWSKDRLAQYDQGLIATLCEAAKAAGTEMQVVGYDGTASDASMVYAAGGAARIGCIGHVRENSHGYEVARLSSFDNVFRTLAEFVAIVDC